ncbi:AMP-binding protein [Herbiconiux sp. CPCC 203407]|uniref:AMP-binding protein n=1 Tax=Herbiconiux oxytropis TaxID=2970915 RepID=A0AA41XK42_9MICO|nr:AMP-binding protein [Herbiconiux oxytropis]MCS5722791.1 AMP-binding protein [Herbiconiux oxytropis]MCS5727061.1 AMP-binding protein [Herbiconiux oxytropis]
MTRALEVIDGSDAAVVERELRRALGNDGSAILPREGVRGLGDPAVAGPVLPTEVPKRVSLVIETSGSSGLPKRVALSSDALLASAAATEAALGGPGQWLLALPTHYIAGVQVLVRSIVAGIAPVVHPRGHFSAETFADLAEQLQAPLRFTSLVPAQLVRLVEASEADPRIRAAAARFDAVLVGGQALPDLLAERASGLGIRVVRTYGSSETAGGCVYDGIPIGRASARVVDGELELAGPMLAEGYLGDDELTADRFRVADGTRWYRTADSGTVVDGVVRVTGRVDNVIISGGVKVSLDRVERLVQSVPGFEQAVVVPRASERWGQVSELVVEEGASGTTGQGSAVDGSSVNGSSVNGSSAEASSAGGSASEGRAAEGSAAEASAAEGSAAETSAAEGSAAGGGGERVPGGLGVRGPDSALERVRAVVIEAAGRPAAPAGLTLVRSLPRLASGKPDRAALAEWFATPRP